ncbi:unnamed protein product [Protopolystoma xenopodis]|uniref:Uncharacterized protein n=1 Tax=Protopolystoma xenopodis TaxID=117903 RepID=A0A3S5BR84_9PLAT|nr:unnamed protein product [Protopolystoma xenopodis]
MGMFYASGYIYYSPTRQAGDRKRYFAGKFDIASMYTNLPVDNATGSAIDISPRTGDLKANEVGQAVDNDTEKPGDTPNTFYL